MVVAESLRERTGLGAVGAVRSTRNTSSALTLPAASIDSTAYSGVPDAALASLNVVEPTLPRGARFRRTRYETTPRLSSAGLQLGVTAALFELASRPVGGSGAAVSGDAWARSTTVTWTSASC